MIYVHSGPDSICAFSPHQLLGFLISQSHCARQVLKRPVLPISLSILTYLRNSFGTRLINLIIKFNVNVLSNVADSFVSQFLWLTKAVGKISRLLCHGLSITFARCHDCPYYSSVLIGQCHRRFILAATLFLICYP